MLNMKNLKGNEIDKLVTLIYQSNFPDGKYWKKKEILEKIMDYKDYIKIEYSPDDVLESIENKTILPTYILVGLLSQVIKINFPKTDGGFSHLKFVIDNKRDEEYFKVIKAENKKTYVTDGHRIHWIEDVNIENGLYIYNNEELIKKDIEFYPDVIGLIEKAYKDCTKKISLNPEKINLKYDIARNIILAEITENIYVQLNYFLEAIATILYYNNELIEIKYSDESIYIPIIIENNKYKALIMQYYF